MVTAIVIGSAYAFLLTFFWSLCVAAGNADRSTGRK